MKVLITGANGFIGSHLADLLVAQGCEVRGLMHTGDRSAMKSPGKPIEWVSGDLKNPGSFDAWVYGCHTVIHLAGLARFDARLPESDYLQVNVRATRALVEASRRQGVRRFVYISSIEAVGLSQNGEPLTEQSIPRPRNIYGRSKLLAEKEVCLQAAGGLDCIIVRLGTTYGPREHLVFDRMVRPISKGIYVLFGDGSALIEFSYVKNQVAAIWQAAQRGRSGETYFASDAQSYAYRDVVREMARQMAVPLRLVSLPLPLAWTLAVGVEMLGSVFRFHPFLIAETGRPPFSRSTLQWAARSAIFCDTAKAKRELGCAPSYSLAQGLQETVQWYHAQGWL